MIEVVEADMAEIIEQFKDSTALQQGLPTAYQETMMTGGSYARIPNPGPFYSPINSGIGNYMRNTRFS